MGGRGASSKLTKKNVMFTKGAPVEIDAVYTRETWSSGRWDTTVLQATEEAPGIVALSYAKADV